MQTTGFVTIDGRRILVLVREHRTYRAIKLRTSGKPGREMTDESRHFSSDHDAARRLMRGEVVKL